MPTVELYFYRPAQDPTVSPYIIFDSKLFNPGVPIELAATLLAKHVWGHITETIYFKNGDAFIKVPTIAETQRTVDNF